MTVIKTHNAASFSGAAFFILWFSFFATAQSYRRTDTIPVTENSNSLKMPWVGGHNFCQFSDIDVNFDGIKDLFVFDRTGHKVSIYINKGTPNTVDYVDSTEKYAPKFPHLEDWALIRDFNCDGLPDIFTYAITVGGIKVWKNTSSGGNLQFTLETLYIQSDYGSSTSNLFISRVDLPTIDDIDYDGDLDILTFDITYTYLEWHVNKSKELYGNCDSLTFKLDPGCWGKFTENLTGCDINDSVACRTTNYDSIFRIHKRLDYAAESARERHAGNCSMCLDEDGDGDKEVLLGQLSCCNFVRLTNTGTSTSAFMTLMDDSFPSYDIPATLTTFPCGYFLDVNNDNKRDLIIAPNAPNISIDDESIWFYKNIGTDLAPVFQRQTRSFLQEDMIEAGEGSSPAFFDFTADGLVDLLVSNYSRNFDTCMNTYTYNVRAYKNIGTISSPKFDLVSTDYANLSSQIPTLSGKHLTFGDLNNDGDNDMIMGDFDGKIHYFNNTAGAGNNCNFILAQQNYLDNNGVPIDIGSYATPQLIDTDRDGDLDLIIGERAGNVNYYENIGTPSSASFKFISDSLGGVDVLKPCCTGYSVPFMYDSAGSYRLLVASEASRQTGNVMNGIWQFKNIDGNLAGKFSVVDSNFHNIWEGIRMTVNGADINNDGGIDLAIGNYSGGVAIYMADSTNVSVNELDPEAFEFTLYPNPSSGQINVTISRFKQGQKYQLNIYNLIGEKVFATGLSRKQETMNIHVSNGIYSCEIKSEQFRIAKKLIVLK